MTKDQIIEGIYQENQGFITRREINERKIPSWFLSSFVKKKDLKKIAPGFYAAPDFAVNDYWLLQTRYPQYIFSSMSALYLHHLMDKILTSIYVTGPQGYHPFRKPLPPFGHPKHFQGRDLFPGNRRSPNDVWESRQGL